MRALVASRKQSRWPTLGWALGELRLYLVGTLIVFLASMVFGALVYGHGERKVTVGSERVTAGPTGGTVEPVNMKNPGPHR
jgi:hypothetical protein